MQELPLPFNVYGNYKIELGALPEISVERLKINETKTQTRLQCKPVKVSPRAAGLVHDIVITNNIITLCYIYPPIQFDPCLGIKCYF